MHIERHLRDLRHALTERGAKRNIFNEMPVHHIEMQPVRARSLHVTDALM